MMRATIRAGAVSMLFVLGGLRASAQPARVLPRAPAPRSGHAMTYDEAHKSVLLFGGGGASLFRDLWEYRDGRWTRLANSGPLPRDDAILVHDARRGVSVLFGGRGANGRLLGDTWEWDGTSWKRRDEPGPGARLHAAGAFDRVQGCLRVHGGVSAADVVLTDTWEWNGERWKSVASLGAVPGRAPNRMAFDSARGRTLLTLVDPSAATGAGTMALELWEWGERGWRALPGTGPELSPLQAVIGLGGAGGLLLVDGGALQGAAHTARWSRGAWTTLPVPGPSPRNGHALALDESRSRVVLFGGFRDGQDFADTWEWDGARWTRVGG